MPKPLETVRTGGKRKLRCAIYTRKSSEEGLEQGFNSLDAQREACSAYVASQRHEGWSELPELYDDGGFSGGTMDRPALQRLLADVAARKIDVIVVYKVDRLTRALSDFARIVDVFDKHAVSFVSVTQQFNTTSSMGRLTLNVLLSFAQFEREVTGERIRDKIAASKAKGMWMGGFVSLGYDARDRKLVVNEAEAQTVRHIFRRYAKLGSVRQLKAELDAAGIRSKARVTSDGMPAGQARLARGALYLMLQNPIYRGQIRHKDKVYPGEHEPIIEVELWDRVQALIKENRVEHNLQSDAKAPSLLAGLLFDAEGERMTPTHAVKKGKRFRYYVSLPLITGDAGKMRGQRIPAAGLESLITKRLTDWLNDSGRVLDAIGVSDVEPYEQARLIGGFRALAFRFLEHSSAERRDLLLKILLRVQVHRDRVEVVLSPAGLLRQVDEDGQETGAAESMSSDADNPILLTIPARLRRAGKEMRLILEDGTPRREISEPLVRLLLRAHALRDRLFKDTSLTVNEVAAQEGIGHSYATRLLRLAFLSPSITAAILRGDQPPELTARKILGDTRLPLKWADQHKALGVA